jgi:hypothetical protein
MHADTATVLAVLVGVIIPHITSLVSNNRVIPAWAGGYVTLLLAAGSGFCSEWAQALADGTSYSPTQGAARAIGAFLIAGLSRLVVHRDTPPEHRLLDAGAPRSMRRGGKPAPGPGPYAPEHEYSEPGNDAGAVDPWLIVVIVLILIVFGWGFTIHVLWWLLIILVAVGLYVLLRDGTRRRPRL